MITAPDDRVAEPQEENCDAATVNVGLTDAAAGNHGPGGDSNGVNPHESQTVTVRPYAASNRTGVVCPYVSIT